MTKNTSKTIAEAYQELCETVATLHETIDPENHTDFITSSSHEITNADVIFLKESPENIERIQKIMVHAQTALKELQALEKKREKQLSNAKNN